LSVAFALAAAVAGTAAGSAAMAGNDLNTSGNILRVELSGFQEDPLVFSTAGSGQFRALVNERVTQAHIHLGGVAQSGGISVFLCTNAGNGPAGTQACPAAPGTITGTITPADIIGPVGQGIAAGQFAELATAIRAGKTYVNVHSSLYPGGEIRAQLDRHH
jgi:hypothetical protein